MLAHIETEYGDLQDALYAIEQRPEVWHKLYALAQDIITNNKHGFAIIEDCQYKIFYDTSHKILSIVCPPEYTGTIMYSFKIVNVTEMKPADDLKYTNNDVIFEISTRKSLGSRLCKDDFITNRDMLDAIQIAVNLYLDVIKDELYITKMGKYDTYNIYCIMIPGNIIVCKEHNDTAEVETRIVKYLHIKRRQGNDNN